MKALRDKKGMDSIYDSLKSYSKDFVDSTTIHWDSDGRVIGVGNKAKEYYYKGDYEHNPRLILDSIVINIEGWVTNTRVAILAR